MDGGLLDRSVEYEEEQLAEHQRLDEIQTAQNTSGLKKVSITQAEEWITEKLEIAQQAVQDVTDVATAKAAMNQILLAIQEINHKEIPYILK